MASDDPIPPLRPPPTAVVDPSAEVDRLLAIIDRAAEALGPVDYAQLSFDLGRVGGSRHASAFEIDTTWRAGQALNAMVDARAILAEADPPDPEGGEHA
jgi:hypothetical protein